jgi:hypothetical protein
VFRNYTDLFLVFLLGVGSFGTILFAISFTDDPFISVAVGSTTALLALYVIGRTFMDNPNPLYFAIALLTKVALCALFLPNLLAFAAPTGGPMADRSLQRHSSLFWLLLFGPIVYRLVRDKEGLFNPARHAGDTTSRVLSSPDHPSSPSRGETASQPSREDEKLLLHMVDDKNMIAINNVTSYVQVVDGGVRFDGVLKTFDWTTLAPSQSREPPPIQARFTYDNASARDSKLEIHGSRNLDGIYSMKEFRVVSFAEAMEFIKSHEQ